MKYKTVVATRRGPPEVLEVRESDLRAPLAGEVRVRIMAACVCGPDIQARYGQTPFPPRIPFVPGYTIIGDVDAVGEGVTAASVGDRVAALTIIGGYAEFFGAHRPARAIVPTRDLHFGFQIEIEVIAAVAA